MLLLLLAATLTVGLSSLDSRWGWNGEIWLVGFFWPRLQFCMSLDRAGGHMSERYRGCLNKIFFSFRCIGMKHGEW